MTFDADYSGIELDDPTTEREITINGSAIRSKENVFLVLSYAIG
jgi:Na+-translocating ferredoxin:NAD+ oxidoreductase RnfC subunit